MHHSAVIFGCAGPVLLPDEAAFFRAAQPWGFILFGRNVEDPAQLRRLTADLRAAVGWGGAHPDRPRGRPRPAPAPAALAQLYPRAGPDGTRARSAAGTMAAEPPDRR
ncbi:beta-hexosamidase [Ketogulonicigenium vulgare Y25]|nr:beta-hexosamidase [Ketogulonicigenium vulgare Y25]